MLVAIESGDTDAIEEMVNTDLINIDANIHVSTDNNYS